MHHFLVAVRHVKVADHEGDEGEEDGHGDGFGHHESEENEELGRRGGSEGLGVKG